MRVVGHSSICLWEVERDRSRIDREDREEDREARVDRERIESRTIGDRERRPAI
jgi:hypothetical protein